ncbi:nuclear transport factor 2 family protein [Pseudomonas sp. X10]
MQNYVEDRLQISDLMTGWIHRDLGQWEQLLNLAHPDGTIEITWFKGLFSDFVKGSQRMGASDFRTKHVIANPVVTFNGDKPVVETNAVIIGENAKLKLGCTVHNRFYDLVEKRRGQWKIFKRQTIYDMGAFTFPQGPVEIDQESLRNYPREYAALAYLLEHSGFPLQGKFATRGDAMEQKMRADASAWLA